MYGPGITTHAGVTAGEAAVVLGGTPTRTPIVGSIAETGVTAAVEAGRQSTEASGIVVAWVVSYCTRIG